MNTANFLSIPSTMFPDQEILVFEDTRLTYGQELERVRRLASMLRDLGIKPGDRVAMLQTNSHQFIEAYYATATLGGTSLLCAPLYHIAGTANMMTALWAGRKIVVLRQFDAKEWLEAVQKEKVTHAFVVPTMLKQLIDCSDFAKYDLSSLENLSYGG